MTSTTPIYRTIAPALPAPVSVGRVELNLVALLSGMTQTTAIEVLRLTIIVLLSLISLLIITG